MSKVRVSVSKRYDTDRLAVSRGIFRDVESSRGWTWLEAIGNWEQGKEESRGANSWPVIDDYRAVKNVRSVYVRVRTSISLNQDIFSVSVARITGERFRLERSMTGWFTIDGRDSKVLRTGCGCSRIYIIRVFYICSIYVGNSTC